MKNTRKFIVLALIAAITLALSLAGCASMQLVSLETDTVEGPKQVRQGQDINPKDITVYGIYKDESRKAVTIRSGNIVFDKHTPGPQTVKVNVSGKEAGFQTQVMPLLSLTAAFQPTTTLWTDDEPDPKWPGLEIRGAWDQMESDKIDTASCEITGYNKEQAGSQTITVSYEGKTTAFNVNVTQSHPLRGRWVVDLGGPSTGGVPTLSFENDGTYASGNTRDGTSSRGTYTTNGGKITMTLTHVEGKLYPEYGCLPIMLYTRTQMEASLRATETGKAMTDDQINAVLNSVYTTFTRDYSINGDKLSFNNREYVKS